MNTDSTQSVSNAEVALIDRETHRLIGLIGYERSLLGAVMLIEENVEVVDEEMQDADWVSPDHLLIWRACRDIHGRGKPTAVPLVAYTLEHRGQIDKVGDERYLVQCVNDDLAGPYATTPSMLRAIAAMLHTFGQRRRDEGAAMTRAAAEVQDIRAGSKPHWWDEYEEA